MMYQGREGFTWFTGVVEDRNDPLFLNRVRVRIHGAHSHDKQLIATPDLPWSDVMMPTTSPSLSGLGTSTHGLVEGSSVMGFYRDDANMQAPVVIGSFIGVPQSFHRIDESIDDKGTRSFTKIERTTLEGFNDPRLESDSSYKGTPDGPSPKHIVRGYGLTLALDKSPRRDGVTTGESYPKKEYLGTSDVNVLARDYNDETTYPIIETVFGEPSRTGIRGYVEPIYPFNHVHETESGHVLELKGTPDGPSPKHIVRGYGLTLALDKSPRRDGKTKGDTYPKIDYLGTSDVNVLARDYDDKTYPIIETVTGEPKRGYVDPIYPFNHVHETESGHVLELDDTPDFERIHLYHRKGTRVEIDKDGNYVEKIVKDKYSVVLGDDTVTISGNVTVNITGDADIKVDGDTALTSPNTFITSDVIIEGTLQVTGAVTAASVVAPIITSGAATLATHTHPIASGSSAGSTLPGTG
jgi:hypothetical protein